MNIMTLRHPLPALAVLSLLASLGAGCVSVPAQGSDFESSSEPQRGTMTAEASETVEEGTDAGSPAVYYAERIVTVVGDLTLDRLPVRLATFNGNVDLSAGPAGTWSAEFRLRGEGPTEEDARAAMEAIVLTWSHTEGSAHVLDAVIEPGPEVTPAGPLPVPLPPLPLDLGSIEKSATIAVTLPGGLAFPDLTAATSNGNVHAAGFRAGAATLSTSNGNVDFEGAVGDLTASTSNGNVGLDVTPLRSGGITASSSNGNVDVRVPEGPRHGYDVEASTSNGNADIGLTDGRGSTNEEGTHAEFQTSGFSGREVRTTIQASTSNGNASVGPS